jgi:hypothetical protein
VLGLVAALGAFAGALTWRLGLLVFADQGEEAAETLVLQHRRLGNAPQPVEGPIGHAAAFIADLQSPIGEVHDLDSLTDRRLGVLGRLDHKEDVVVLERQGLRQGPLRAPGEGLIEPIPWRHGPMESCDSCCQERNAGLVKMTLSRTNLDEPRTSMSARGRTLPVTSRQEAALGRQPMGVRTSVVGRSEDGQTAKMEANELAQSVATEIEEFEIPLQPRPGQLGVQLPPEWFVAGLAAMRAALVAPYRLEALDYDTTPGAVLRRSVWIVADDRDGTLLAYDPMPNGDYALIWRLENGDAISNIRGDAVGCFLSR